MKDLKIEKDKDIQYLTGKRDGQLERLNELFEEKKSIDTIEKCFKTLIRMDKQLRLAEDAGAINKLVKKTPSKDIESGTIMLATYGYNNVLDEPFERLYEFGYYTSYGCVVYKKGERNMQDASAFKMNQIKIATPEEIENNPWG